MTFLAKLFSNISLIFLVLGLRFIAAIFSKWAYLLGKEDESISYACILLESNDWGKNQVAVQILKGLISTKKNLHLAQANLGHAYLNGLGVEEDIATAIYWYEQSVQNGFCLTDELRAYLDELKSD